MIEVKSADRWKKVKLFTIFDENKQKNTDFSIDHALQFYFGSIIPKKKYELTEDLIETYMKYTIVRPGDIMINGLNLNYDFVTQRIGFVSEPGIITSAYISLRLRSALNASYYCYLFKALDAQKLFHGMGTGIRLTLSYNELKYLEIPAPPREEQDQIVRFLDWKVSEINKLINIKKQIIIQYGYLRKAIIDNGILYGFKQTERKDSGVYWLGEIPEHWDAVPLKRICDYNASVSKEAARMNASDMVTFLPMENVSVNGEVNCSIKKPLCEVASGYSSFAKGDVVIAKITPCFENGKGACLDCLDTEIGYGTTELINLRPKEQILSRYLYMITMTRPFRTLGEQVMTGSAGQKRIPSSFVKNFSVGIPPINEQCEILIEIEKRLTIIDELIKVENKKISTLQEFKTRLISDVVTGKIDVRGIEIPEYEYTAEDADIDSEMEAEEFDEKAGDE